MKLFGRPLIATVITSPIFEDLLVIYSKQQHEVLGHCDDEFDGKETGTYKMVEADPQ